MKKSIIALAALISCLFANAQDKGKERETFQFTTVKENYVTPVKNQYGSNTCWCFSTTSFIESEAIRKGWPYKDLDLAEMFTVSHEFSDRAYTYVRTGGNVKFSSGTVGREVFINADKYGMVPQAEMQGRNYGREDDDHHELLAGMKGFLDSIRTKPNGKLTPVWHQAIDNILATYLGKYPETFTYQGKQYTPQSFWQALNVKSDEYLYITSWTDRPYYTEIAEEVADNWRWDQYWNVPLDEFMAIVDNAIMNGYTLVVDSDYSDPGIMRNGIALMPDYSAIKKAAADEGSDQAHWLGTTNSKGVYEIDWIIPELDVTPEMRMADFDNKSTQDDHLMHCFGIAKDQKGNKFYMIKNSTDTKGKYDGIWYYSVPCFKSKVLDIIVHKDAVPAEIRAKLGIE